MQSDGDTTEEEVEIDDLYLNSGNEKEKTLLEPSLFTKDESHNNSPVHSSDIDIGEKCHYGL